MFTILAVDWKMSVTTENFGRQIPLAASPLVVLGAGLSILARKSARVL